MKNSSGLDVFETVSMSPRFIGCKLPQQNFRGAFQETYLYLTWSKFQETKSTQKQLDTEFGEITVDEKEFLWENLEFKLLRLREAMNG